MAKPASKPSSAIGKEARLVLRRWARQGLYVYLRPLTSKYLEPTKPFRVHWRVMVEARGPWRQWSEDGYNLSEIIMSLSEQVLITRPGVSMPLREGPVTTERPARPPKRSDPAKKESGVSTPKKRKKK